MAGKKGYKGKIQIGQVEVLNIAKWTPSGMAAMVLDGTALGDDYDVKQTGRINPGSIVVEGHYDPADSTGQEALRTAFLAGTAVQTMRFYFGTATTDFLYAPGNTTMYLTNITGPVADKDASGLCPVSFTIEISDGILYKAAAILEAETISFSDSDPDTINDSGNGLVTAGFLAGMNVVVEGSTSNDGRAYTIDTGGVAAGALTLVSGDALTSEIAGDAVALIGTTL